MDAHYTPGQPDLSVTAAAELAQQVVIGSQRRTKSLFRPVTFDIWDGQSAITGCAIVHFRVLRELAELDRTIQRLANPFGSEWTERYCGLTEQNWPVLN